MHSSEEFYEPYQTFPFTCAQACCTAELWVQCTGSMICQPLRSQQGVSDAFIQQSLARYNIGDKIIKYLTELLFFHLDF